MGVGLILISLSQSILLLYVVMGIYGVGFAFLFPSLNSLLIDATKKTHRGKAYGYFYAFFSIGVVIGSGVTGLFRLTANEGFLYTGVLLILVSSAFMIKRNVANPTTS